MRKTFKVACFVIFCHAVFFNSAYAQNNKLGGWYFTSLFYQPTNRTVLFGEVQTRSQKALDDFYYHEIKAGAGYYFKNRSYVLVGFGDYETFPYPGTFKRPASVKEFRIWEQLVMNTYISSIKIEHRYRIEQRWLNGEYRNRFRYRINPTIPINHATVTSKTLYATAFDEVFFTSKAPYFERNRIFGGLGFQFNPLFALQAGFIRQFDYRKTDEGTGKNFIQSSLLFTSNYSDRHKKKQPL